MFESKSGRGLFEKQYVDYNALPLLHEVHGETVTHFCRKPK